MFCEKLLGYLCVEACLNLVGGETRSGDNLDRVEWTAQAFLHIAKAQSEAAICGRFSRKSRRFGQSGATPRTLCKSRKAA